MTRGGEYIKEVKGKVIQITNSFIVIDNGNYKESFKYSEFTKCSVGEMENEPYDLLLESYTTDIVGQCLQLINQGDEGYVFNYEQLKEVINNILPNDYVTRENNNIYYIKKIN